jgi:putative polymerase
MLKQQKAAVLAYALVILSSAYLLLLCGLYTANLPITNVIIALVDAAIVTAALTLAAAYATRLLALPVLGVALSFAFLALFSQNIDLKSLRDVLLIIAFLVLGLAVGDRTWAQRAFFTTAALILFFGTLELAFPEVYAKTFNVLQFYIMRGELSPAVLEYTDNSLFISSMRNQGRFLLPFLGPHRVSSIFLEPVSMGNFGAIAIAWALAQARGQWKIALAAAALGVAAIIMADARFAAMASGLFLIGRLAPIAWMRLVLAPAPFLAIALLLILGASIQGAGDDLPTRLAQSGNTIAHLNAPALFGLTVGRMTTLDSGYAYVLTSFGLPLCLAMWAAFVWLPTPGELSTRFKFLLGLYICALLCVSGSSLFALKTAALAWFLLGCAMAHDYAHVRAVRERAPRKSASAPQSVSVRA